MKGIRAGRWIGAGVLSLAVTGYVYAIVAGTVPQGNRLGLSELGIILSAVVVIAVILSPTLLDRLQSMRLGGVEVQLLNRLEEKQERQGEELDWIAFALTLLLTDREQRHLRELATGSTDTHAGGHQLRTELRRLATLRLVRRKPDVWIHQIQDEARVKVADFVEITDRGLEYLARIAADQDAKG